MPIYDYKCNDCGIISEILVNGASHAPVTCPQCGSDQMKRLLTASYAIRIGATASGRTCCGREERCDAPSCSTGRSCHRES